MVPHSTQPYLYSQNKRTSESYKKKTGDKLRSHKSSKKKASFFTVNVRLYQPFNNRKNVGYPGMLYTQAQLYS